MQYRNQAKRIKKKLKRLKSVLKRGNLPVRTADDRFFLINETESCLTAMQGKDYKNGGLLADAIRISRELPYHADEPEIKAALSLLSPTESFLRVFPVMRCADALCRIYKECLRPEITDLYYNAVCTLRTMKAMEWDRIFCSLSGVERILIKDPSGAYLHCTEQSRQAYRSAIARLSLKTGETEESTALRFLTMAENAENEERDIACQLFERAKPRGGECFFLFSGLTSLLSAVLSVFLSENPGTALLLYFGMWIPLYRAIRRLADKFIGKYGKPLLRLSLVPCAVNADNRTLVIITALLNGTDKDHAIFASAERIFHRCGEAEVRIGLLCDYPEADAETTDKDAAIRENAIREIRNLNRKYGENFYLFLRRRSFHAGEKRYFGWERKRGAILMLCRYLRGRTEHTFSDIIGGEATNETNFLDHVTYLFSLDADTDLAYDSIREGIACFSHPFQNPKNEKNSAVLVPSLITGRTGTPQTHFQRILSGNSGWDAYGGLGYDDEETLFHSGNFTGKGFLCIDRFLKKLDTAFPADTVLSHDFPEGLMVSARLVPNMKCADTEPTGVLPFYKRKERWIRGDIQNLIFVRPTVRNAEGNCLKNPFSLSARFRILDHALLACGDGASLLLILLSLFCTGSAYGQMFLLCLAVYDICSDIRSLFHLSVLRGIGRRYGTFRITVRRCFLRLILLGYAGTRALTAVFITLYRMLVSHRNLLSWVTAEQSEAKHTEDTPQTCFRYMRSGVICGAVLLCGHSVWYFLLGILWMLSPIYAYYLKEREVPEKSNPTVEERAQLKSYIGNEWRFFSEYVTEKTHFLPPDNLQWFPNVQIAPRTSPTDIGLYLLSCFAAVDFGLLSVDALTERLSGIMYTLLTMDRYRGHFCNWYTTRDAKPEGKPVISCVDSGNLACALMCCASGAEEYGAEDSRLQILAFQLRKLAEQMDFSVFYCEKEQRMAVTWDPVTEKPSRGQYDLYASEVRSAVYFAVAMRQIPMAVFEKLSRPVTADKNGMGIFAWFGSAFEYFMPELWLSTPSGTLTAEMLSYARRKQTEHRYTVDVQNACFSVIGKSEGGYFAFDTENFFQYQPCGVPSLAIGNTPDAEQLVMPYASFLMLDGARGEERETILSSLNALKLLGVYGSYGFYEALDMTPKRCNHGYAVVRSVMAHHKGMTLAAMDNILHDGIIRKRFLRNARMKSALWLLEERFPYDAAVNRPIADETERQRNIYRQIPSEEIWDTVLPDGKKRYCILSNTVTRIIATDTGEIMCADGEWNLTRTDTLSGSLLPRFFLNTAARQYSPCICGVPCAERKHAVFRFCKTDDRISYMATYADGVTAMLSVFLAYDSPTFRFRLQLMRGKENCPCHMTVCFRPMLAFAADYHAHPSFFDLFLESRTDEKTHSVIVTRRPRTEDGIVRSLSFRASGLRSFSSVTDMHALLPIGADETDIWEIPLKVKTRENSVQTKTSAVPVVCVCGAADGDAVFYLQADADQPVTEGDAFSKLSTLSAEYRMLCNGAVSSVYVSAFLSFCANRRTKLFADTAKENAVKIPCGRDVLWKYGISGDCPLIGVRVTEQSARDVSNVLSAWKYLRITGIRCDLVCVTEDADGYSGTLTRELRHTLRDMGLSYFVDTGGQGRIHILAKNEAEENGLYYRMDGIVTENGRITEPYKPAPLCCSGHPDGTMATCSVTEETVTIHKGILPASWSFCLTNGVFGTVLTADSLGFTFFGNARECRVTPYYGEILSDVAGEQLLLTAEDDTAYDLCRNATETVYTKNAAEYRGCVGNLQYCVSVRIPDRRKRKELRVLLKNNGEAAVRISLCYIVIPLMSALYRESDTILSEITDGKATFRSLTSDACAAYRGCVFWDTEEKSSEAILSQNGISVLREIRLSAGVATEEKAVLSVLRHGEREINIQRLLPKKEIPTPTGHCGNPYMNPLYRTWLPVQIFASRLWGRTGYYQPGGAYGFRDQLQDALSVLSLDSTVLRNQIYRCAAHQYLAGDVQHWWHPLPRTDPAKSQKGIRSRYSDDRLWLVYAVSVYIASTGDDTVLDRRIAYLESPVLSAAENERYEEPLLSETKESVYMHCIRALESSFAFGAHGLPLMGSGDWNDGMNAVGIRGNGESVWLGMFLLLTLGKFLPVCRKRGDRDGVLKYEAMMETLDGHIREAFNGRWYLRAWYDDGTPMGNTGDTEAETDILPQAFAAFLNHEIRLPDGRKPLPEKDVYQAVCAMYDRLYDGTTGTLRLLFPPFSRDKTDNTVKKPYPGYIAGYPAGIRENGGQYTHAAVWGCMALYCIGETKKADALAVCLSPLWQTRDKEALLRYRKEPYALCGDILMADGRAGEGGWSQYTGSAGWYFQLLEKLSEKNKNREASK